VPAEGYRALPVVIARQEDREARLHRGVLLRHLGEEAEAWVQCQGVKPEAEDTVECEEAEGVGGHLRSKDDPQVHAVGGRLVQTDDLSHELAKDLAGAEGNGNLVTLEGVREDESSVVLDVNSGC